MKTTKLTMSTGMPGLDQVLQGLQAGDNVVWEVDGIGDYLPVLGPLCNEASRLRRKLIYFRFARHAALLKHRIAALDAQSQQSTPEPTAPEEQPQPGSPPNTASSSPPRTPPRRRSCRKSCPR